MFYFNNGIRAGGGIGELISKKAYKDDLFFVRWATDLVYFITIILLLLNMINGIIVSTFSAIREETEKNAKDLETMCLICSLNATSFRINNLKYRDHIQLHHNVYNYIYFILMLKVKPKTELDSDESYVKEMLDSYNVNVFPIKKSMSLGEEFVEKEY